MVDVLVNHLPQIGITLLFRVFHRLRVGRQADALPQGRTVESDHLKDESFGVIWLQVMKIIHQVITHIGRRLRRIGRGGGGWGHTRIAIGQQNDGIVRLLVQDRLIGFIGQQPFQIPAGLIDAWRVEQGHHRPLPARLEHLHGLHGHQFAHGVAVPVETVGVEGIDADADRRVGHATAGGGGAAQFAQNVDEKDGHVAHGRAGVAVGRGLGKGVTVVEQGERIVQHKEDALMTQVRCGGRRRLRRSGRGRDGRRLRPGVRGRGRHRRPLRRGRRRGGGLARFPLTLPASRSQAQP